MAGTDFGEVGSATVSLHYKLDTLASDLGRVSSTVNRQVGQVERSVSSIGSPTLARRLTAPFQALGTRLRETLGQVTSLRGAILGIGIAAIGKSAVDAARSFERINTVLAFATGSTEAARKEYEFIRKEADRLGLSLESTAQAYASFAAAAKGSSLEGEQARQIFLGVSEAAATLKLAPADFEGALYALQQMVSKGVVSSEELRQQLGERLPGAMAAAGRAMGYGEQEMGKFYKQLELGQVQSSTFLPRFAAELRKTFGPTAGQAAKSATAEINRFSTALFEVKTAFGTSGFLDGVVYGLNAVRDTLADPATQQGLTAFGAFVGETIKYLVDHSREIGIALAAFAGLKAGAALGSPFGARGSAIGGALGAATGAAGAMMAMSEDAEAATASVADLQRQLADLNAQIYDFETSEAYQRNRGLPAFDNELKRLNEEYDAVLKAKDDLVRRQQEKAQAEALTSGGLGGQPSGAPALPPLPPPAEDSDAKKARKAVEEAQAEAAAQKRLLEAYGQGAEAVQRMTVELEAEKAARSAGIALGSEQYDQLRQEIAARAQADVAIEKAQARLDLEADLTRQLADAQDELVIARLEAATVGQEGGEAILAVRRAELELTRQGIAATSDLGRAYIEAARSTAQAQAAAQANQDAIDDYNDALQEAEDRGRQFGDTIAGALEESIFSFESVSASLKNLAEDLARLIVRMTVLEPLARSIGAALTGAFAPAAPAAAPTGARGGTYQSPGQPGGFALGAAFMAGRVTPFAKGGVVTRPVLFPMARGMGLMGEAGPEAVLPLKRGADGKLGVSAEAAGGGGGVQVNVYDQRSSGSSAPVEVKESSGPDGRRLVEIIVREVKGELARGGMDAPLGQRFGLRPSTAQL